MGSGTVYCWCQSWWVSICLRLRNGDGHHGGGVGGLHGAGLVLRAGAALEQCQQRAHAQKAASQGVLHSVLHPRVAAMATRGGCCTPPDQVLPSGAGVRRPPLFFLEGVLGNGAKPGQGSAAQQQKLSKAAKAARRGTSTKATSNVANASGMSADAVTIQVLLLILRLQCTDPAMQP